MVNTFFVKVERRVATLISDENKNEDNIATITTIMAMERMGNKKICRQLEMGRDISNGP